MSDFFGRPFWLILLPLAVASLPFALVMGRRALANAAALTRERLRPRLAVVLLLALALVCAVLAAAQPRWGERSVTIQAGGSQLVAVLDVSRSMGSPDVAPSRLTAVRDTLAATFTRLRGDRVALVVFAGNARLRFPLTRDLGAAATVVANVESGTVLLDGGTSLASGLALATELFDDEVAGGRLVLLVSDGDNLGEDPRAPAAALAADGIELLVVGVGTPVGGVVPVREPVTDRIVPLTDADGTAVITRLDEGALRAIADAGDGRYLGADLDAVPASVRSHLSGLDEAAYRATTTSLPVERFQWFAAAALAFVVIATALEWRAFARLRRPLALAPAVALALLLAACATSAYDLNERALDALDTGDVDAAIELLYDAQAESPQDGQITLNLAAALHRAERYDEAARVVRRVLADRDTAIATAARSSLGHHLFALGELEESLEAFAEALLLTPDDDVLRRDYEVVYRLLHPEPPPDQQTAPARGQEEEDSEDGEEPPGGDGAPAPVPSPDGEPGPGGAGGGDEGEDGEGGQQVLSPVALEAQLAAIDAQIAELREEAGEALSAREALQILELLEERSQLAARNAIRVSWNDAGDY